MINSHFSFFFPISVHFFFFFSLLVGAELLSILDETENGFIWEHIQSYVEQAHGAWLGISVKGRATLHQSLPSLSTAEDSLTFIFFNPRL